MAQHLPPRPQLRLRLLRPLPLLRLVLQQRAASWPIHPPPRPLPPLVRLFFSSIFLIVLFSELGFRNGVFFGGSLCRKMTGFEYMLCEVMEPHLFVIRKQKRDGPEKVTPMLSYYILDGSIYQAPQLCNVFSSRIVSSLSSLALMWIRFHEPIRISV